MAEEVTVLVEFVCGFLEYRVGVVAEEGFEKCAVLQGPGLVVVQLALKVVEGLSEAILVVLEFAAHSLLHEVFYLELGLISQLILLSYLSVQLAE